MSWMAHGAYGTEIGSYVLIILAFLRGLFVVGLWLGTLKSRGISFVSTKPTAPSANMCTGTALSQYQEGHPKGTKHT